MRDACFSPAALLTAIVLAFGWTCSSFATAAPTTQPGAYFDAPVPHRTGHYRILYHDTIGARQIQMMTVFSVSDKIAAAKEKVPLLVYLCGVGDRGSNGDGIFFNGPPVEMERDPVLKKEMPVLCMSPQCPADHRWDEPVMVQAVVDCIKAAKKNPWVDGSRIYLTGLSMGGKGTWLVAEAAPKLFAAIVPISAVAVDPSRAVSELKTTPTWIIDGALDAEFRDGSRQMAAALGKAGGDVMLSELPNTGHNAWAKVYNRIQFYDWLTFARQGQPGKAGRPEQAELDAALNAPQDESQHQLTHGFQQFAPYWWLTNCGNQSPCGLQPEFNGKSKVFLTYPLAADIPALLRTTWLVPSGHKTKLIVIAGYHPGGEWKLIIRADGKEKFSKVVDAKTTPNGWLAANIDLSAHAGHYVHLEVINAVVGNKDSGAVWAKVAVETE